MAYGQFDNPQYRDFERAWYMQTSSATMSADGKRTDCSGAVDATGKYIWREDGRKDGRCCGIDFQQAEQKRRAKIKCSNDDPICGSAMVSTYVPFAYDAVIALAHGLDKLLRNGMTPDKITATLLFEAIQQSSFLGVTGKVSFKENGDRKTDDLVFIVYNYHASVRGFKIVGRIMNESFDNSCSGAACPSLIFSNGGNQIPNSEISVRATTSCSLVL